MNTETLEHGAGDEKRQDVEATQHVTFRVGDEMFAVPMAPLSEIIRLPEVVRVPLSPPALEGLVNLRGQVLPIVNLRRVFGFAEQEHDDATRVLVVDTGAPVGFVVDQVSRVIGVTPDQIEASHGIEASVDNDYLHGVIKGDEAFDMLMLLDFSRVLQGELAAMARTAEQVTPQGMALKDEEEAADQIEDELQLVSFSIDDQEYAIPIEHVKEIVQLPEQILHVPKAPPHMLGLINLRSHSLPLVSLRRLFELSSEQILDEHQRIIVVAFEQHGEWLRVGLMADSVREVLRVPRDRLEEVPALLRRDRRMAEISGICRLDDGQRLVSILSVDKMFAHEGMRDALKASAEMKKEEGVVHEEVEENEAQEEEQFVIFRMLEDEYGVPIQAVKEIVRVPEQLTHVPKAPEFIEGIINLRGSVLPVVDERLRLGLPHMTENERQRIMVFVINGMRTGFIVDSVTEVLRISTAAIKDVPDLSENEAKLIPRVANLEDQGRMILLLDAEQLLETHEVHALSEVMND